MFFLSFCFARDVILTDILKCSSGNEQKKAFKEDKPLNFSPGSWGKLNEYFQVKFRPYEHVS